MKDGNRMEYNESDSIHDYFSTFEEEFVRKKETNCKKKKKSATK